MTSVETRPTAQDSGSTFELTSVGARRGIEALYAVGHPESVLAEHLGYSDGYIPWMRRDGHLFPHVSTRECERVAELVSALWLTEGPDRELAKRCLAEGVASFLAWDDINDPTEKPRGLAIGDSSAQNERTYLEAEGEAVVDHVAVQRAISGRLTDGEQLRYVDRLRAVALMHDRGAPLVRMAEAINAEPQGSRWPEVERLLRDLEFVSWARVAPFETWAVWNGQASLFH